MDGLGFGAIRDRLAQFRRYLWERLDEIPGVCIKSPREPGLSSAITCISIDGVEPREIVDRAWEANIVVVPIERSPARPELHGVRVSPGFYNSEGDLDRFIALTRDMAL